MPNWLTRQRKTTGSNTSLFGNRYSKNMSHETLSSNSEALRQPPTAVSASKPSALALWGIMQPLGPSASLLLPSAWMMQALWPLRCLCWALHGLLWLLCLPLCLCAGLSTLSLPLFPVLTAPRCWSLIWLYLASPALVNRMTDHSSVFSHWPSSLLLYFPCWSFKGRDYISNQRLRLDLAWSMSFRTF